MPQQHQQQCFVNGYTDCIAAHTPDMPLSTDIYCSVQQQQWLHRTFHTRIYPRRLYYFMIQTVPTWCEREASLSGQAVVRRVLPSFPWYLPSFLSYIWFRIPTARPFPSYVCRLVPSRVGDGQRPRIMCNQYVVILRIHYISADIRT